MSIWKEIKSAINSTLGTENFKPLNEYIEDMIIISPTSDVIISGRYTGNGMITPFTKTMNLSGQLKISGSASLQSGASASIRVSINDEPVAQLTFRNPNISGEEIITVNKGDILSITVIGDSYANYVNYTLHGGISYGRNMFR